MPLTTSQAAQILRMHEIAVCKAIRDKRLKAVRFGRRMFMIQPADLREFVVNHPRPNKVAHVDVHALV